MHYRDQTFYRLLVAIFITTAFLVPVHAHGDASYRLGVALGLSGTGAQYSQEAVEGLELAVNEINADGGLLGKHRIELFIRDTLTNPETAERVAAHLVKNERISALIGTYSSACALKIKPICRKARVLHISPISNSENITRLDFSPYTFSVVPNTYMMSNAAVMGIAGLVEQKGWKSYVTIASDYAWGKSSQAVQVDLLRRVAPQINLLAAYWPRLGQTRFNSFIVDMLAQKPDFVLASIAGTDNTYWLRDARDYRLFKSIENPGGLVSVHELIEQARSIRRGLYGRCRAPFFAHLKNPVMVSFVDAYKRKFDRYPTDWAVLLYDAVHILRQGVEKAQSLATEQVKDALTGSQVDTTRGRYYFRNIDNQLSCSAYFGRVADDDRFAFPIYHDLKEFKAEEIWRPAKEIQAARNKP